MAANHAVYDYKMWYCFCLYIENEYHKVGKYVSKCRKKIAKCCKTPKKALSLQSQLYIEVCVILCL